MICSMEVAQRNSHIRSGVVGLPLMFLATRSNFAAFLSRTIQLSRLLRDDKAILTFFPIPIPFVVGFSTMPAKSSSASRKSRNVSRAAHVMRMALSFWYSGRSVFQQFGAVAEKAISAS